MQGVICMTIEQSIDYLRQYATDNNVPIVRHNTGLRLAAEVHKRKPKRILEIGTAIGYSALLMLQAYPSATITTIEKDDTRYNFAKDVLAGTNTECIHADAMQSLERILELGEKYDFVFLDGPKGQYYKYLQLITRLLNTGGCIFADNIGFFGMVQSGKYPHRHKTIVTSLTNYISEVTGDGWDTEVHYEVEDGYAISTKL